MNNRLPVLSRINPETRDNDFIPITELKKFDTLLDEIVTKFSSLDMSSDGNVAQKLKDIEFNIADALILDNEGNITGYRTDDSGNPVYGEDAIDTLLSRLDELYNQFVSLMGNDPNIDNWKYDLDHYYTEAINELKNKVRSIFKNSANMTALEAKEDATNNYVLADVKRLTAGSIMRLNPDTSAYTRTVNIDAKVPGEDNIIFEVIEAVKDTLALNLKLQNGKMYFDFNIVIDNGNIFVSNEKVVSDIVEITEGYFIKIHKYYPDNVENAHYVFTFCAPVLGIYNFEITGVLISGFNFNNTGLKTEAHSEYWKYNVVTDAEPKYNETYYTKETDPSVEDGKVSYIPVTNLTSFEAGITYYTKDNRFTTIKEFDIFNGDFNGDISNEIDGQKTVDNYLKSSIDQIVVDKPTFTKKLKMINVAIENKNILKGVSNKRHYLKNEKMWYLDDSVRFVKRGSVPGRFEVLGKKAYKPTNKDIMAFGETIFEKYELEPGEIITTNEIHSGITASLINSRTKLSNTEITVGLANFNLLKSETVFKYDFLNDSNTAKLFEVEYNGTDISDVINNYIMKNISFVNSFDIKVYQDQVNSDLVYIYVLTDNSTEDNIIDNRHNYFTFVINTGSSKASILTYISPEKIIDNNQTIQDEWVDISADNNHVVALGKKGIYYSFDGVYFYKDIESFKEIDFSDSNVEWKLTNDGYGTFILYNKTQIFISQTGYSWNKIHDSDETEITFNGNVLGDIEKIVCTGLDRYWIICENKVFLMLERVFKGIQKYNNCVDFTRGIWTHTRTGVKFVDVIYNHDFYVIIGTTSGGNNLYLSTATENVNYTNTDLLPAAVDLAVVESGAYGSASTYRNKNFLFATANGIYKLASDTTGSVTKVSPSGSTEFTKIIVCAGEYSESNYKTTVSKAYAISDTETLVSTDFGETWAADVDTPILSKDIYFNGNRDFKYIFRNTVNGLFSGVAKTNTIASATTLTSSLLNPKFAYTNQNDIVNKTYCKFFVTDNNTKTIYYTSDGTNFNTVKFIGYQPITKLYSVPNESVEKDVETKYGHNGYSFAETSSGNLIYSTLDKTFVKNPVDESELREYVYNRSVDGKVIGVRPLNLQNTVSGRIVKFDSKFNVTETTGFNNGYITDSIYIDENGELQGCTSNFSSFGITAEYGFETDDGVFVVGLNNDKESVCFASYRDAIADNNELTFTIGFTVDVIDYLKPYNNDIIISTYDETNSNLKWKFNRDTLAFESASVVDSNKIASFNEVYVIDGELYVWNGTGSDVVSTGRQGFYKLSKSDSNSGNTFGYWELEEVYLFAFKDEYPNKSIFNIPMIEFYEEDGTRKNAFVFSYLDDTDILNDSLIGFKTFVYDENQDKLVLDNTIGFTSIINEIIINEIRKISEYGDNFIINPDYTVIVQSPNKYFDHLTLTSESDVVNNPNLLNEKYYFDKENSYISFNTFGLSQTDKRFVLTSEKIALGTTVKTGKTNLAIALSDDCKVAIFDNSLDGLKTVGFTFNQTISAGTVPVVVDPKYFSFHLMNIGSSDTENNLYLVIYGKFPNITYDNNTQEFSYDYETPEPQYKLFSVSFADILANTSGTVYLSAETEYSSPNTVHTGNSVKEFIKTRKYNFVSKDLDLSLIGNLQYIGTVNGVRYQNTDSLIFWNTTSNSIDFVSKINLRNKLKTVSIGTNLAVEPVDLVICENQNKQLYTETIGGNTLKVKNATGIYQTGVPLPYGSKSVQVIDNVNKLDKVSYICEGLMDNTGTVRNDNNEYKNISHKNADNRYIQTSLGLIKQQLTSEADNGLVNKSIYKTNDLEVKFVVDGKTITLRTPRNAKVLRIIETFEGIFISVKCNEIVLGTLETVGKLYRIVNIPNGVSEIDLFDTDYIEETYVDDALILDIKDTQKGLFAVGWNTDIDDPTKTNTMIFMWNGDEFSCFHKEQYTRDSSATDYDGYRRIIESKNNILFNCVEYNLDVHKIVKFVETPDLGVVSVNTDTLPIPEKELCFDQDLYHDEYDESMYFNGVAIKTESGSYAETTDKLGNNALMTTLLHTLKVSTTDYDSSSFNQIAEILYKKGIPLDKNAKVIGSIVYNGIPVSISNLRVMSDNNQTNVPMTVAFSIDKEFRLPNDIFIGNQKNFTNNNANNEYSQFTNKGIICNYDIDTRTKLTSINNVITKCNFTIVTSD